MIKWLSDWRMKDVKLLAAKYDSYVSEQSVNLMNVLIDNFVNGLISKSAKMAHYGKRKIIKPKDILMALELMNSIRTPIESRKPIRILGPDPESIWHEVVHPQIRALEKVKKLEEFK